MRTAIIATLFAWTACAFGADVVPGVSRELARERKGCLDDVRYSVTFRYPGEEDPGFVVEEDILFRYSGGLEDFLQIDFAGEEVGSCEVNGRAIAPEWREGHILVPADLLRAGDNSIRIGCRGSGKALNANPGYMYTLFVPANAHSAFPCFDQPDLKGRFTATLHIPEAYECMSTMEIASEEAGERAGTRCVAFRESPPLPTYLMSWVIGDFKKSEEDGMTVLHNETDSLKAAQIPEMRRISANAVRWLENYTGIPYPFGKYDFAIIPGFQFGGMEHPGAVLYPPETTLLGESPTPEEILWRYEVISHETSHMWFGDLVTMRWFDDVWTKEVFANFMASKISSEAFPEIDHTFNFIRGNYPAAYSTDRTDGTHAISQELGNLADAGLVYGNIIYNKAPIMMRMLEKRIGEERLRDGLRAYLGKYAMANSSWDELIELLDSIAPEADVKGFSEAWVKKKGMPEITVAYEDEGKILRVSQSDPTGGETVWPQSFSVRVIGTQGFRDIEVELYGKECMAAVDTSGLGDVTAIVPNSRGEGYGYFRIGDLDSYLGNWRELDNGGRYAAILNLGNAWVKKDIGSRILGERLMDLLPEIDNPLITAAAADLLAMMAGQGEIGEEALWEAFDTTPHASVRQRLLRSIYGQCLAEPSAERLYGIWEGERESLMNVRDYMAMSYRLAILKPESAEKILEIQRGRIADNANLAREFDFISRACTGDADLLLLALKEAENRNPEPWTAKLLALLLDPARNPTTAQLRTALDLLPEIKATGGIFFPTLWAKSVMNGVRSPENRRFVKEYCRFLDSEEPLSRKLLEQSFLVRTF